MKKIILTITFIATLFGVSCKKSAFEDAYRDPSKVIATTVGKQFTGMIYANREFVVPSYLNYFVVFRPTINHYTQAVGWANSIGQYVPGAASIANRWDNYYNFLAQYRELQKVYNAQPDQDKENTIIYLIAAGIYFYDHTQKVVDLHGDIPWQEAGKLSTNNGNYSASYAKYQNAEDIYSSMLDELKNYAEQLSTITVNSAILKNFKTEDLINKGDISLWQKYCNSLRLRLLMRVSGTAKFSTRASQEIAVMLANPSKYPLLSSNTDNITLRVYATASDINAKGFETGLEDWNGNLANKTMIDRMNTTADPRLRVMFEPGANAAGVYNGLNQLADEATQTTAINSGTLAIYNRSTLSRNQFFPGVLITAAEVNFLLAEYYLKANNDASAKMAYENGITQSINYYYWLRSLSNNTTAGAVIPTNTAEIALYLAKPTVAWLGASSSSAKLNLIATQKWIHYSVVQPLENWAEIRRLDLPVLNFQQDNSSNQNLPPYRWLYPSSEVSYNTPNYQAVKAKDNLQTKIFWDN